MCSPTLRRHDRHVAATVLCGFLCLRVVEGEGCESKDGRRPWDLGWHGPFALGDAVQDWPPLLLSLSGLFWFMLKILFFFFMFAMVKAIVPRYRYDQLMRLGWKIFLPTSLAAVLIVAGYVVYTGVQS